MREHACECVYRRVYVYVCVCGQSTIEIVYRRGRRVKFLDFSKEAGGWEGAGEGILERRRTS